MHVQVIFKGKRRVLQEGGVLGGHHGSRHAVDAGLGKCSSTPLQEYHGRSEEEPPPHLGHLCAAWQTSLCQTLDIANMKALRRICAVSGVVGWPDAGKVQSHRTIDQHGGTENVRATHCAQELLTSSHTIARAR